MAPFAAAVVAAALFALCRPASPAWSQDVEAVDVSVQAGLFQSTLTYGGLVFDYNGDGWDDFLLGRHFGGFMRLYRNNRNGTFTNITPTAFPIGERKIRDPHMCAAGDVNRDGRPDLYCTTGGRKGGTSGNPKKLWIQRANGEYVQRTHRYGVGDRYGRGRFATFVNANGDGYPDLYVGNTYPRKDGRRSNNRLFINEGGVRFRSDRSFGVSRQIGARSLQAIDFNRDGRQDLVLCGKRGVHIFRNVAYDHYRDVAVHLHAISSCDYALMADMNGDRRPDLITATPNALRVQLFGRDRFRRPSYVLNAPAGRAVGGLKVAVGDVNGDGLNDIYYLRAGPPGADLPDKMLVNRRGGRHFTSMRIPQTSAGVGDSVEAIDYDRNGLTDFIVENGHRNNPGPVRLIAFR